MKERAGDRSAACSTCGKTFARSDTLLRHEKSHQATEDRGPVHRVTNGTFRACCACATARSRCSGGTPCGRCNLRKIECVRLKLPQALNPNVCQVYPNKRRKGESSFEISTTKLEPPEPQPRQVDQYPGIVFAANEQFQFRPDEGQIPKPSSNTSPGSAHQPLARASFSSQSMYQEPYLANPLGVPIDVNAPPAMRSVPSMPTPVPNQYQQGFGEPASSSYDYNAFEDSLNWIPISVFPSPYEADLEQDFSFLLPPLSSTPGMNAPDYGTAVPIDPAHQVYEVPQSNKQYQDIGAESSGFPMSLMGFEQSPASSASDHLAANRSATGSTGPSEAKRRRRKSSFVPDLFTKPRNQRTGYAFPPLFDPGGALAGSKQRYCCSEGNYDTILNAFRKLCVDIDLSSPFETSSFPDLDNINACIDLYFDHFHTTCPLLHQSSFGDNTHWIVILATAAIGSTFVKAPYALDLREGFQEFLRRAIHQSSDGSTDYHLDISLAQARILNLIGLTQSDREQLRSLSPRYHAELSRWCLESGVLQLPEGFTFDEPGTPYENDPWNEWGRWKKTESLRRIGYMTWLLDTSLGYMANARPLCNMDDARTPLPCLESLWAAGTIEEWQVKSKAAGKTQSLCAALEEVYAKKAINPALSELSQILLINALFQRTWEVGTHIKQPMSEWVPTGKARGFLNTPTKDNFWLPLYPLYANWRNSACDCLDVIHWQASADVAKASGVEHDLVLHLHLARIILLTPFQEIQDLLLSLIGKVGDSSRASFYVHDGSYQPRNQAKLPQIRKITWRWLREDQHKARLAMIHAGSVFWHVRRYSSTSFYEPFAVYLASVVLWTYASYKSAALERDAQAANSKPVGGPSGPDSDLSVVQPARVEWNVTRHDVGQQMQQSPTSDSKSRERPSDSESDSESSSDQPEFIHLDRPCDDEMVQHFVRNGHNMSGHMSNVGDICKMPQKVLLEGAKLLRTRLSCWGVSREYYDILTKLAELRKGG